MSRDYKKRAQITMRTLADYYGIEHEGKADTYIRCPDPTCSTSDNSKKLNISFTKDLFRCNKCGESGRIGKLHEFMKTKKPVSNDLEEIELFKRFRDDLIKNGKKIMEYDNSMVPEEEPIADIEIRAKAYRSLVDNLELSKEHYDSLINVRGLDESSIRKLDYRTAVTVNSKANRIADTIRWKEGNVLDGVPGFFELDDGEMTLTTDVGGLLIPIKDLNGNIQSFQIRKDKLRFEKEPRFQYLTSGGKKGGTRAKTFSHFVGYPERSIILTEGPMKADIINFFTNRPVLAIPGVNARKYALEMLEELYSMGVRHVDIAFDMDVFENVHVMSALKKLVEELNQLNFSHRILKWDTKYKGYDDYLKYINDKKEGRV